MSGINSMIFSVPERYYIYIVANADKTVLDTGVTGDLAGRLYKLAHGLYDASLNMECYNLLYWESLENVHEAMKRERELRGLSFKRKKGLIETNNPEWRFLNDEVHRIS